MLTVLVSLISEYFVIASLVTLFFALCSIGIEHITTKSIFDPPNILSLQNDRKSNKPLVISSGFMAMARRETEQVGHARKKEKVKSAQDQCQDKRACLYHIECVRQGYRNERCPGE